MLFTRNDTILTMQQESLKSIRDLFFGFLKLVPDNRRVYDISFGTIGYSLILARAFQDVGL